MHHITVSACSMHCTYNLISCRDGLLGDLAEDRELKPQVTAEEKKGGQEVAGEEIEDTTQDGSHTPSSQQMERPEGRACRGQ